MRIPVLRISSGFSISEASRRKAVSGELCRGLRDRLVFLIATPREILLSLLLQTHYPLSQPENLWNTSQRIQEGSLGWFQPQFPRLRAASPAACSPHFTQ
jgi:hypothetical protein